MTFDELLERVVWDAQRTSQLSPDRLRVIAEAAFPQINSEVSEAYAAKEDNRALLRKNVPLVFVGGSITIPNNVLRKYLKDATLLLSTGEVASLIEPYADFLRNRESRLPWWAFNDSVVSAKNSITSGGGVYVGSAALTCIASPDIPLSPIGAYTAPDDMVPDVMAALIAFLAGKPEMAT